MGELHRLRRGLEIRNGKGACWEIKRTLGDE